MAVNCIPQEKAKCIGRCENLLENVKLQMQGVFLQVVESLFYKLIYENGLSQLKAAYKFWDTIFQHIVIKV